MSGDHAVGTSQPVTSMAVTRHPTIRKQIASILRDAIVNLDLRPGQMLIERELCELTGASRPSVREALRQLEAEGLVESRNGRGTYVRELSLEEALDVYEVRAELEGLAARLFSERADKAHRDRLRSALVRLRGAITGKQDSHAILEAQKEFYAVLFDGAHNAILDQIVQGLQVRVAQLRAVTLEVPGRDRESLSEFEAIAAEIRRGDAGAAEVAATAHVKNAAKAMAATRTSETAS